jgi:hypothetical protein
MKETRRPYDGLAITWFAPTDYMARHDHAGICGDARRRAELPDGHLPIIVAREHVVV